MAGVKYGSKHGSGFFLMTRMVLFFFVTMVMLESGKGFVDACPTAEIQQFIDNPEQGAARVVAIGKIRIDELWRTENQDREVKTYGQNMRWDLRSKEEIDRLIASGKYTPSDKDMDEQKRMENEKKDAEARKFTETFKAQKFSDGKSCITGKKPITEAESKKIREVCDQSWDHEKMNYIVSKELGYRCSNKKCHYHHKIDDFVCQSTSNQAMAFLLTATMLFLGLYEYSI